MFIILMATNQLWFCHTIQFPIKINPITCTPSFEFLQLFFQRIFPRTGETVGFVRRRYRRQCHAACHGCQRHPSASCGPVMAAACAAALAAAAVCSADSASAGAAQRIRIDHADRARSASRRGRVVAARASARRRTPAATHCAATVAAAAPATPAPHRATST